MADQRQTIRLAQMRESQAADRQRHACDACHKAELTARMFQKSQPYVKPWGIAGECLCGRTLSHAGGECPGCGRTWEGETIDASNLNATNDN